MKVAQLLGADLSKISTKDLLFKHSIVIALIKKARKKEGKVGGLTLSQLIKLDSLIVKELRKRGVNAHRVKRSLNRILPFQIKNPYVIVTGSVFYGTPHDLDFMIFTPLKIEEDPIARVTKQALEKFLPEYTHWSNAYYGTPFSTFAPVYNLELTPPVLSRKYAPMYPKNYTKPISIDLHKIVNDLPEKQTLIKNFVHYAPAYHLFLIPKIPIYYFVPLYIRLQRMFPVEERPEIKALKGGVHQNCIPVYDLTLRKVPFKVTEM